MNNEYQFHSPIISEIPQGCSERLVDTGMLHYESSVAGYNERYHRGETSHTIHVWWARRPHSAMRSLVFSSLCKDTTRKASELMASLAMNGTNDVLNEASELLKSEYKTLPRVLDMFGGGGTIPFEAKKLGLDSYSIDANQLSVFIQLCNMQYSDQVDMKLAIQLTDTIGKKILNSLKKKTDWLYPLRSASNETVFGYFWSYERHCKECGKKYLLVKRPWVSKKHDVKLSFSNSFNNDEEIIAIKETTDYALFNSHWEKKGVLCCPHCGCKIDKPSIQDCSDVVLATVSIKEGVGKEFAITNTENAVPSLIEIRTKEKELLNNLSSDLPSSELPQWSGIVNPALYGVKTHADFLNARQRLLLIYLIDELVSEFESLRQLYNEPTAKFVIGVLSSLIDQVVDWNCRMSMWIPQNEQVGRAFCGPGIAWYWDYIETDQLLNGPANLWDKLKRIVQGVKSFEGSAGNITIRHAHAQELPFDDNYFDAIVTDPPYYDNIYYSILADFFYAWKKILLKKIEPSLFETEITDCKYELVASSRRAEEGLTPHESYCRQLELAFGEASRVLKADGIFSFVYSHSSVNGWEAVLRAYRNSPFIITSVQPLSIERKGRPRAVMSQAINTCMTFVARKANVAKTPIGIDTLLTLTNEYIESFGKPLIDMSGWEEEDAGLATLACIIGKIANSSNVVNSKDDATAILTCAKIIKEHFPEFNIKVRDSL